MEPSIDIERCSRRVLDTVPGMPEAPPQQGVGAYGISNVPGYCTRTPYKSGIGCEYRG